MSREEYERELEVLQDLYSKIDRMSERKAQQFMNSDDTKTTILMYIQEDMDEIYEKLEEYDNECGCGYNVDPAFSSWSDFYRFVI